MTDQRGLLGDLGQIPQDEEGPVFDEPWQAAAFALAVRLSQEGHFTWHEWADTLSREIAEAQRRGDPDLGNRYYHHWVVALERLCADKGLVARDGMDHRKKEWRQAYLNTPHGKPIELSAASGNRPQPHN
jgi:nitrile hydratase accessory protein